MPTDTTTVRVSRTNFDKLSYLREAGEIFKGALGDATKSLDEARADKSKLLTDVLVLLICHAGTNIFPKGDYSRSKAKKFKEDVMGQLGISAKQAGKWTESISAALGVRGLRKGVRPMDGLMAVAMTGPVDVRTFLAAKELSTFNQFMNATRIERDPVQALALNVHKLSKQQRERLARVVDKLDKDEDAEDDDE